MRRRSAGFTLRSGALPSAALRARALAPRTRRRLLRDFAAFATRLGETDRDGLLAALDRLPRAARLQLPALHLVHRLFDLLRRFLAVSGHGASSFRNHGES